MEEEVKTDHNELPQPGRGKKRAAVEKRWFRGYVSNNGTAHLKYKFEF
jgi:hypothetical protein